MKLIYKTLFLVLFFVTGKTYAQDFVYTPKNPAFGGSPYNYSWLLSSAQAQNNTKEATTTSSTSSYSTDPLKNFTQSLNQQILSQLSRQIVSKQFGEGGLTAGTYVLGDYQIQIADQTNGLNITIIDNKTGSQTSVVVPYF
ncbi:curli production assembly/transport component CsgF [Bacteroides luti]|uniref:Curli production assembly/transport component CsgF n=1 Tax=Bacteroides luti TaxID=1297750 RepID=A0A1M4Y2Y1_9BACE|nr:curli production assembly/transport component CsgF [Bacteroides luti]SHF00184.1 curli production assembly/transport component CsgF [Bacteroides luti]